MKKLSITTAALAALIIVLAALGSVCGAAVQVAFDEQFYSGMSRQAVMDTLGVTDAMDVSAQTTAYIGLTDEEQTVFAEEIVSFMKGETDAQPGILNEREQQHMLDVRGLIHLAQQVSKACTMLAAALAVVIAWTGASLGRGKPALLGAFAGCGVMIFAALGAALALNSSGFAALFVRFHEIAFTNDLWLLNPETDILIRMMPQLLFERAAGGVLRRAAGSFGITAAMLCAIYMIFGNMIRRNLKKREEP